MLTPTQQFHFSQSVCLLLSNWFVLKTAVEQGWGGRHSSLKAKTFIEAMAGFVTQQQSLNEMKIQDFIEETMNHEFCTLLEDDSGWMLAKTIYQLYVECQSDCFDKLVSQIQQKYGSNPTLFNSNTSQVKPKKSSSSSSSSSNDGGDDDEDSNSDSDSESDGYDSEEEDEETLMDLDDYFQLTSSSSSSSSSSLPSPLSKVNTQQFDKKQQDANIDDDGFTLVKKNGKHSSKQQFN